jgi:hypothetical protein
MNKERKSLGLSVAVWAMRVVTLAISLWAAFFVNPINWKLYSILTTGDRVWSWLSNGLTLFLTLALWWWCQRFLTRKIDENKEQNQSIQPTPMHCPPSNQSQPPGVG